MEEDFPSSGINASQPKDLVVHADEAAYVKTTPNVVDPSTSLMTSLSENFKAHMDQAMTTIQDQNQRNTESILTAMQQETAKRTAMEQRLYSLVLLQNERMAAMELKLLRLEAKVERREASIRQQQQQQNPPMQQQRSQPYTSNRIPPTFTTINESALEMTSNSRSNVNGNNSNIMEEEETPPNMAVISSGASLASGVTAGSFLGDDGEDDGAQHDEDDDDDRSENRSDTLASDSGNPVTREVGEDDYRHESQQSTPTQGSRPRIAVGRNGNLESILLNPMIGESGLQGLSVRATRGFQDTDGNSSLATSVTNSTFTSTVVTATTRGDLSTINVRRIPIDEQSEIDILTPSRRGRSNFAEDTLANRDEPRSRSQSPLTVNTHASETMSMASASTVGTSIRSSVAVAPRSGFGRRVLSSSSSHPMTSASESRPLPDRVVSFTPDLPYNVEATGEDSFTMADELDNISEDFAISSRAWREEIESRLDALHKRWSNE